MGYDYTIFEGGNIQNNKTCKFILSNIGKSGYKHVCLFKKGKRKTFDIHRLLAIAFIPNIENKPYVNHKDGDKLNNNLSNLEWYTAKENVIHVNKTGLIKRKYGINHHRNKLNLTNKNK